MGRTSGDNPNNCPELPESNKIDPEIANGNQESDKQQQNPSTSADVPTVNMTDSATNTGPLRQFIQLSMQFIRLGAVATDGIEHAFNSNESLTGRLLKRANEETAQMIPMSPEAAQLVAAANKNKQIADDWGCFLHPHDKEGQANAASQLQTLFNNANQGYEFPNGAWRTITGGWAKGLFPPDKMPISARTQLEDIFNSPPDSNSKHPDKLINSIAASWAEKIMPDSIPQISQVGDPQSALKATLNQLYELHQQYKRLYK